MKSARLVECTITLLIFSIPTIAWASSPAATSDAIEPSTIVLFALGLLLLVGLRRRISQ